MKATVVAAVLAAIVAGLCSTAIADIIPDGHHYMRRDYVVTGLAAHGDYKFVLVATRTYEDGEVEISAKPLAEGTAFHGFSSHWSYELSVKLVAVKGELPATVTAEFLQRAEKIELPAGSSFRSSGYVPDENPAYRTCTFLHVEIVRGAGEDAIAQLKLTTTRTITFDEKGGVLTDSNPDAGRTDAGGEASEADDDGWPESETRHPANSSAMPLLLALSAVAAIGLAFASRSVAARD